MTAGRGRSLASAVFFLFVTVATATRAEVLPIVVDAKPIVSFDLDDKNRTRFGTFEFVGGLAMRSSSRHFGALSGLRVGPNDQFIAVADTGYWLAGKLQRTDGGKPVALGMVEIAPMLDADGEEFSSKWQADAESVSFSGKNVYVGTEQDSRVLRYSTENFLLKSPSERVTPFLGEGVFGYNNGFESLATFPPSHSFAGSLIAFRETTKKGTGKNSPIPGFILKEREMLPISVAGRDGFSVTDADFLPGGDLLILERLFSMSRGVNIRIRRISGADIKPGALLDGKVIFNASRKQQVDNMEGLSVFNGPDGSIRIGMVSDNNHWLLQRNLYLEFKLVD